MKQCAKSHLYDEKMYKSCPYCNNDGSSGSIPIGGGFPPTQSVNSGNGGFPPTQPVNEGSGANIPPTMPVDYKGCTGLPSVGGSGAGKNVSDKMGVTIAITPIDENGGTAAADRNAEFINPVCGWLVAVDGEKTGLSFPIHSERNSVGRGDSFDVNLNFDGTVSSSGDAVIIFDSKGKSFYITPGAGKNNVYVNNKILLTHMELNDYDKVQIGKTTFVFRSFCSEQFMY